MADLSSYLRIGATAKKYMATVSPPMKRDRVG